MDERLIRWRLVLGEGSQRLGALTGDDLGRAEALDFLYEREAGGSGAGGGSGGAGGGAGSRLTIPEWINQVHELFPRRTVELVQKDALQRYQMTDLVLDRDLLERVEPSEALLQAVLRTKHLMNDEVLTAARHLVRRVVQQLVERLRPRLMRSLTGRRDPQRRSFHKVAANFDARRTIRANLRNWSPTAGRLVISDPIFVARTRRESQKWQFIIAVDQSGSMTTSVIHSAVTASIFQQLPALRTHLLAFDTEVVDLTSDIADPVETLMKVQLGGGTDIARAMTYVESLVTEPRRTMAVLITDLEEGGSQRALIQCVRRLVESGVRVLVLGALDSAGTAALNADLAATLAHHGAKVATMTPHHLAEWVAEVVR